MAESARGSNYSYYQPLHIAILKGDWESAKAFLDCDPSALTAKIGVIGRTALHVAAVGAQWQLVEKLVQRMPAEALAEKDLSDWNCLHYVAMGESIQAAKALVAKNPSLTQQTDKQGHTPLLQSMRSARCKEMAWYLALNTTDESPGCPFSGPKASLLVRLLTAAGFHDITMHLLNYYPNLATISDSNGRSTILYVLSEKPSDFQSGNKLGFLRSCIYHGVPVQPDLFPRGDLRNSDGQSIHHQSYFGGTIWDAIQTLVPSIKLVRDAKLRHVFSVRLVEYVCSQASTMQGSQFWLFFVSPEIIINAASTGIIEILRICFHFFPDLLSFTANDLNIVETAIKYRREEVFGLICRMPIIRNIWFQRSLDSEKTTSHLAARFAFPQLASVPGAAFKMQKELQWFKEVERLDHPVAKGVKNQGGNTPWQLFREEHKTLLEEGEKWMKETSNSCMLVSTLIATVVFAAVLTVPGGNNQEKGNPILLSDNAFLVFAVSDALALFSSMASLLMFLSILTARYAEEDFLKTLPQRLVLGLASLFFAIVTTMIAFSAALSLVLGDRLKWVSIPIALLACVPVALFAWLQLPLFVQMIISTYGNPFYHPQSLW